MERTTFCYPDSHDDPSAFGVVGACSLTGLAGTDDRDKLDDYVEAQVHGHVDLAVDVEALVLDPSYRGTPVEAAARDLPCPVEWHDGFVATVRDIRAHPEFRGAEIASLAEQLAAHGVLTPRLIGDAARTGAHHPQAIKQVWHYTARFGGPDLA